MIKNLRIIFSVVPTGERNGGLLKLNRGLSWVASVSPFVIYNRPDSGFAITRSYSSDARLNKAQAKLELKKVYSKGLPAFYTNIEADKDRLLKENYDKAGIYMITNKVTKKKYIGYSIELRGRFFSYFSKRFLEANKGSSLIYRSLLKFGFENFSLTILEYCSIEDLQIRKQYFIDVFKPSLNIRKDVFNPNNLRAQPRLNPHLEEFKKNITIPLKVKKLMDLSESTPSVNPLGWRYHVDKESNGHFTIWFLNYKTDQAFYGYTAYWKDGKILNKVGFYELKAPKPTEG